MDKHRLFPNCPNRENDKIHSSDIARHQSSQELTPEDVYMAKHNPAASLGMTTTQNIFTSIQSLKPITFQDSQLDESYLLQQAEIRQRASQVESQLDLVRRYLKDAPEDIRYFLDKVVTESIQLGESIGEFNERIDALQPMRNDKKYTQDRKSGPQKQQKKNYQPFKDLVNDIVTMLEADTLLCFPPKERLANTIINMVSTKRQYCLSNGTIQKYIQQSRTIKPKGGHPSKNSLTENELILWLDTHFTHKVGQYFIEK
jgi:hypothetical protein